MKRGREGRREREWEGEREREEKEVEVTKVLRKGKKEGERRERGKVNFVIKIPS